MNPFEELVYHIDHQIREYEREIQYVSLSESEKHIINDNIYGFKLLRKAVESRNLNFENQHECTRLYAKRYKELLEDYLKREGIKDRCKKMGNELFDNLVEKIDKTIESIEFNELDTEHEKTARERNQIEMRIREFERFREVVQSREPNFYYHGGEIMRYVKEYMELLGEDEEAIREIGRFNLNPKYICRNRREEQRRNFRKIDKNQTYIPN